MLCTSTDHLTKHFVHKRGYMSSKMYLIIIFLVSCAQICAANKQCYSCSWVNSPGHDDSCASNVESIQKIPLKDGWVCVVQHQIMLETGETREFYRGSVIKGAPPYDRNECTRDYHFDVCNTSCDTDLCNTGDGIPPAPPNGVGHHYGSQTLTILSVAVSLTLLTT